MSAEVGLGLGRGLRLAGLVDGDDSELVPLALAQPRYSSLQLVNGGHTVLVIGDQRVKPAAKLVFLLNDVVCDGSASVVLGFVPSQCDGFVVEINNLRFARLAWRSCKVYHETQIQQSLIGTYCMGSLPGWGLL